MSSPGVTIAKKIEFKTFESRFDQVTHLKQQIGKVLNEAVHAKHRASMIVPGGTTPIGLFKALSTMDLRWANIIVGLSDERWVKTTHSDSNQHLVQKHLLKNNAAQANFIGMMSNEGSAITAAKMCESAYRAIPLPFDAVILGMGNDGHTASWFPHSEGLFLAVKQASERMCVSLQAATTPNERITLTLPAILNSHRIYIHIQGESKRRTFEKAVGEGPRREMPVRYIIRQQIVPVTIFWAP